jgi:hypothetical protein
VSKPVQHPTTFERTYLRKLGCTSADLKVFTFFMDANPEFRKAVADAAPGSGRHLASWSVMAAFLKAHRSDLFPNVQQPAQEG